MALGLDLGEVMRERVGGDVGVVGEIEEADEREEEEARDGVERMEEMEENHEFGLVGGVVTSVCEDELVESGEGARVLGEAREEEQSRHSVLVFLLGATTALGLWKGTGEARSSHKLESVFTSSSNS